MYRNSKCANISGCRSVCGVNFANSSSFSQIIVDYKIRARLKRGKVSCSFCCCLQINNMAAFPVVNKQEQIRSHCKVVICTVFAGAVVCR